MGNKASSPPPGPASGQNSWASVAKATQDPRLKEGRGLDPKPAPTGEVHTSAIKLPATIVFSSLVYSKGTDSSTLGFDLHVSEPCAVRVSIDGKSPALEEDVRFDVPGKHAFKRQVKEFSPENKIVIEVRGVSSEGVQGSRALRVGCRVKGDRVLIISKQAEIDGKAVDLEEVYGISGSKECVICITEPPNTTLLPCRHMCVCDECAGFLMGQAPAERKCPVCRSLINSTVKVNIAGQNC